MDIIFGIDLGTSNTVISYYTNGKMNILNDGVKNIISSKVGYKDNKIYCGNYIPYDVDKIITNFKIVLNEEVILIFINHLYNLINKRFNINNPDVVITVPSDFKDNQREIIKNAFINNKFNIIRIINEPTAAALAYGLHTNINNDTKIMIVDTGAGTLDISILNKYDDVYDILHSYGDNELGGNNFTQVIYDDVIKKNKLNNTDGLFNLCNRMKEKLSYLENYRINLEKNIGYECYYELTQKQYEKLCFNLLQKVENIITNIIEKFSVINYYILVGGSSKLQILQNKIGSIIKTKPWIYSNLETVVAEGACIYGALLKKIYKTSTDTLLVDILPLSLGIETADGNFSVIIPKDTPLPARKTQMYTTDMPNDNTIKVKIYQGERSMAKYNTLVGFFEFDKITIGAMPVILITFKVDINGMISVIVTDKKSGVEKNILIKDIPQYDEHKLSSIIKDSILNNAIDEEMRIKYQRIYVIKTKIENGLSNISNNNLMGEEIKTNIINYFEQIENKLEDMSNIELLEVLKKIDDNYAGIVSNNTLIETNNDEKDDDEKLFKFNLKSEIYRKATLLLVQNPEWKEYIDPIFTELEISNITLEYLHEKNKDLDDLLNETEDRNYKQELENLCIFIQNEINDNIIEYKETIQKLVLETFDQLNNFKLSNEEWSAILNRFNIECHNIMIGA